MHPALRLVAPLGLSIILGAAAPAPKLALMIGGVGYAEAPGLSAVALPAGVSLALSPYGAHIRAISAAARKAGHELLMGLPMVPDTNAGADEGAQALDPDESRADNQKRLDWALAQAEGYDGVTDALGGADGGAFMQRRTARAWLTRRLAMRHLFFIDADPVLASRVLPGRAATVLIDPSQGAAATIKALDQLAADARASGSALGVVSEAAPRTIALLGPWLQQIGRSGITLVPVHDLVAP